MEWVEKELEGNPKPLAVAEDGGGAPALAVPEGQDQVAVLDDLEVAAQGGGAAVGLVVGQELRELEALGPGVAPGAGVHAPGPARHDFVGSRRQVCAGVVHRQGAGADYRDAHDFFTSSMLPCIASNSATRFLMYCSSSFVCGAALGLRDVAEFLKIQPVNTQCIAQQFLLHDTHPLLHCQEISMLPF